jgi:hypothetical protein
MGNILGSVRRRFPISDDEYIENIRCAIGKIDRQRSWLIAFHGIMLAGAIALGFFAGFAVRQMMALGGGNQAAWLVGVGLGMTIGASLGALVLHSIHGLMISIFPMRTERLLIRYHDAVQLLLSDWRAEGKGPADGSEARTSF